VLGSQGIIDHLVNRARPFIYDTALAPASAAGALAALRHLRAHPSLPDVIRHRVADLAERLDVATPCGAVLSVPMPSPRAALLAQAAAEASGVRVGCFRPPSTPDGISRLRITVNAGVAPEDWERAVETLAKVVVEHR
jgi:8-amino-7-oxononanoate synthase